MDLTGIHHVTAITANVRDNYRFYTGVMGMRLVKRSVNQDDVSAYHLFFADGAGSPGTDFTFFDWAMPGEIRGSGSPSRTALRVGDAVALEWWRGHLVEHGVKVGPAARIDGRWTLIFADPEGQRLALMEDGGAGDVPTLWDASPVPPQYQIRGLGPVTLCVANLEPTAHLLQSALNMRPVRQYGHPDDAATEIHVFEMGDGGPHAEVHVEVSPGLPRGRQGAGGVHHVAFRTPTEEEYHGWTRRLATMGVRTSGEVDRYYFKSLYFREPGGVLFEIATDGPGFAVDEDAATLGEKVVLPPFLEPRRAEILAGLKPID